MTEPSFCVSNSHRPYCHTEVCINLCFIVMIILHRIEDQVIVSFDVCLDSRKCELNWVEVRGVWWQKYCLHTTVSCWVRSFVIHSRKVTVLQSFQWLSDPYGCCSYPWQSQSWVQGMGSWHRGVHLYIEQNVWHWMALQWYQGKESHWETVWGEESNWNLARNSYCGSQLRETYHLPHTQKLLRDAHSPSFAHP